MCGCLSRTPIGDLACNSGMCPGWEVNQWPFGSQAGTQSTEPHQPGVTEHILYGLACLYPSHVDTPSQNLPLIIAPTLS